jgi:hypothetical protein
MLIFIQFPDGKNKTETQAAIHFTLDIMGPARSIRPG